MISIANEQYIYVHVKLIIEMRRIKLCIVCMCARVRNI